MALKALDIESCDDPKGTLEALDEVVLAMTLILEGVQSAPTPCQKFMGRVFLEAIQEYMMTGDLHDPEP